MITAKRATLHECCTVYGIEAVYLLLEHSTVDAYNDQQLREWMRSKKD